MPHLIFSYWFFASSAEACRVFQHVYIWVTVRRLDLCSQIVKRSPELQGSEARM